MWIPRSPACSPLLSLTPERHASGAETPALSGSWGWARLLRRVTVHPAFAPTARNTWPSPQKARRTVQASRWPNSPGKVGGWAAPEGLGGCQPTGSLIPVSPSPLGPGLHLKEEPALMGNIWARPAPNGGWPFLGLYEPQSPASGTAWVGGGRGLGSHPQSGLLPPAPLPTHAMHDG